MGRLRRFFLAISAHGRAPLRLSQLLARRRGPAGPTRGCLLRASCSGVRSRPSPARCSTASRRWLLLSRGPCRPQPPHSVLLVGPAPATLCSRPGLVEFSLASGQGCSRSPLHSHHVMHSNEDQVNYEFAISSLNVGCLFVLRPIQAVLVVLVTWRRALHTSSNVFYVT
jgi:hypothetical protein